MPQTFKKNSKFKNNNNSLNFGKLKKTGLNLFPDLCNNIFGFKNGSVYFIVLLRSAPLPKGSAERLKNNN